MAVGLHLCHSNSDISSIPLLHLPLCFFVLSTTTCNTAFRTHTIWIHHDDFAEHGLMSGKNLGQGVEHHRSHSELHMPNITHEHGRGQYRRWKVRMWRGSGRTPKMYAISNRWVALPTGILVLMLLMRPGIVGGTETMRATNARQFCNIIELNAANVKMVKTEHTTPPV